MGAWSSARAADITVDAALSPDLRTVTGRIQLDPAAGLALVDVLSRLPLPTDDLQARRTWPNRPETGRVSWEPATPGDQEPSAFSFRSELPRRYDASGTVPGLGLFANGLWVPQPTRGGALVVLDWEVTLTLPDGAIGVLNGAVGESTLRWTGRADRLALAVVPHGHLTRLPLPSGELLIVESGARRPAWERRLGSLYGEASPDPKASPPVIVETPAYRRLYRAGPNVLFLSDRALRLSGPLRRVHHNAVRRGLLEAALPIAEAWDRALAADALAGEIAGSDNTDKASLRETLGWLAWLPQVDAILYDGDLPYYSDVFDEAHPVDPLADDLGELLAPAAPARSVARKLDTKYGGGTARAIAFRLISGDDLGAAAAAVGVDPRDLPAWRAPCPDQDLRLRVEPSADPDGSWAVSVSREASPEAPPELVPVVIDGQTELWQTGPGADTQTWSRPAKPHSVSLDPDGIDHQRSTAGDRWPARWSTTLAAWIYELDLRSGRLSGFADVATRRQYNTRWLYGLSLETTPENLASLAAYTLFYAGPLQNRRARPVRLGLALGPSILDPSYQATAGAPWTLDASTWLVWETRDDLFLPRRGGRLRLSGGAGWAPGGGLPWASVGAGAAGLLPLGGRLVLGGATSLGLAQTDLPHRKLALGLDGLAPSAALGERRVGATAELRWQGMRNRSVPAGIAWLTDIELAAGAEAAALADGDQRWAAAGWTAGFTTVWDVLGAQPTLISVQAAQDLISLPESLTTEAPPRFYLRFGQRF